MRGEIEEEREMSETESEKRRERGGRDSEKRSGRDSEKRGREQNETKKGKTVRVEGRGVILGEEREGQ